MVFIATTHEYEAWLDKKLIWERRIGISKNDEKCYFEFTSRYFYLLFTSK